MTAREELFIEPDPDWREDAACAGSDPDLFFPIGSDPERVSVAKQVCAVCPVREECLQYAISTNQKEGVWGGYTADERRRLRRRVQRRLRKAS